MDRPGASVPYRWWCLPESTFRTTSKKCTTDFDALAPGEQDSEYWGSYSLANLTELNSVLAVSWGALVAL